MVYIKLVDGGGGVKKMHYPRLVSAVRAARKIETNYNPLRKWVVDGIYYEDGRVASHRHKEGFHEGLTRVLRDFGV